MLCFFFLTEVQLIYNVVLVSREQQSDSVTLCVYYIFFFIMVYSKMLNIVPCAIQKNLVVYSDIAWIIIF